MRLLVTIVLGLGGALVVSGCGGGAGPATPPFNPFGVDPSGSSTEASGSSSETPPPSSGGQQTLAQLCAAACTDIAAACPTAEGENCVQSCGSDPTANSACAAQFQAFLVCITSTPITCSSTADSSIEAPACTSVTNNLATCLGSGTTVTAGAAWLKMARAF